MGGRLAAGERPLTARYALDEVLARGGVGEVWRGRDLRLGRPVAVKVLHGAQADPNFRTRFRAEAQHAARLSHPNIAAVFDYGEEAAEDGDQPTPFLVMELVEGESLADLLARRGRLGVGRTLSILRQLSSALAVAHEAGVVHRDVKPANVLVRRDGVVKITDFGIAASAASAALTETGQVVGTARYLSPEQARGNRGTPASDVYALGLVGYECLAGHPAFDGPDPVRVAMRQVTEPPPPLPPDVPEQVRGLVGTATAKDPARRLSDGAALRDALDRVLDGGRRAARSAVPPQSGTAGYAAADATPLAPPTVDASLLVPLAADDEPAPRRRRWWPFLAACVLLCGLATVLALVGLAGAAGSPQPVRARVGAGTAGGAATSGGTASSGGSATTDGGAAPGPAMAPATELATPTAGSPGTGGADAAGTPAAATAGAGSATTAGRRGGAGSAAPGRATTDAGSAAGPSTGTAAGGTAGTGDTGAGAAGTTAGQDPASGSSAATGSSGPTTGSTGGASGSSSTDSGTGSSGTTASPTSGAAASSGVGTSGTGTSGTSTSGTGTG